MDTALNYQSYITCSPISAYGDHDQYVGLIDLINCLYKKEALNISVLWPSDDGNAIKYLNNNSIFQNILRFINVYCYNGQLISDSANIIYDKLADINIGVIISTIAYHAVVTLTQPNAIEELENIKTKAVDMQIFQYDDKTANILNYIVNALYTIVTYELYIPLLTYNNKLMTNLKSNQTFFTLHKRIREYNPNSFVKFMISCYESMNNSTNEDSILILEELSAETEKQNALILNNEFFSESTNDDKIEFNISNDKLNELLKNNDINITTRHKLINKKIGYSFTFTYNIVNAETNFTCALCDTIKTSNLTYSERIQVEFHTIENVKDFANFCLSNKKNPKQLKYFFLLALVHNLFDSIEAIFTILFRLDSNTIINQSYFKLDTLASSGIDIFKFISSDNDDNEDIFSKYFEHVKVISVLTLALLKLSLTTKNSKKYMFPLIIFSSYELKNRQLHNLKFDIPSFDYLVAILTSNAKYLAMSAKQMSCCSPLDILTYTYGFDELLLKLLIRNVMNIVDCSDIIVTFLNQLLFRDNLLSIAKKINSSSIFNLESTASRTEKLRSYLEILNQESATDKDTIEPSVNAMRLYIISILDKKQQLNNKRLSYIFNRNKILTHIITDQCHVYKSTKHPFFIAGSYIDNELLENTKQLDCEINKYSQNAKANAKNYSLIYKYLDNLRLDCFVVELFYYIDDLIQNIYNYKLHLCRYKVVPMSDYDGFIEFVENSENLANLDKKNVQLADYLTDQEKEENFYNSTAAYCIMTYILGVGDRHQENLMISADAKLFHIDYGYLFGKDPKFFGHVPMRITNAMINALGGYQSISLLNFVIKIISQWHMIRSVANKLEIWLYLIEITNTVAPYEFGKILYNLKGSETNEILFIDNIIENIIGKSLSMITPSIVDYIHKIAIYLR